MLLTAATIISLTLKLYETFNGRSWINWMERIVIYITIFIIVVITAANNWQKKRQFIKLNKKVNSSLTYKGRK
jgi:P-type Ca2+ transporter type 2C